MLPKQYRLRKNSEFIATYAQRKYVTNNYFTINIGKQKPFENYHTKMAFVVSKKIDKRAVIRNRIKRKLRASAYEIIKENSTELNYMSIIIIAKKDCIDADYHTLKKEIIYLLNKARKKYD